MKLTALLVPLALPTQELPRWRVEMSVEIGSGSIDSGFTEIASLAVHAASQTIYVSQPRDNRILVLSFTGQLRGRIGRAGDGPGEFRRLGRLSWAADTLVVQDGSRRAHYFNRAGTVLRSSSLPAFSVPGGQPGAATAATLHNGKLLGTSSLSAREIANNLRVYHLADSGGAITRTIVRTGVPAGVLSVSGTLMYNERLEEIFGNAALVVVAPDRQSLTIVERDGAPGRDGRVPVRTTRLTATGDTVWSRVHLLPTVAVSRRLSDSVVKSIADGWVKSGLAAAGESERLAREFVRVPTSLPAVTSAVHGDDGTTWLRTRTEDGSSVEWLVLGVTGEPLATVAIPRRATLLHANRSAFWIAMPDDDDLPSLKRYVIAR